MTNNNHAFYAVLFLFAVVIAGATLLVADQFTNHEVPASLPDCEEDEVLDYVVYDGDVDKRVYKCVHVDDL